MEDLQGLLEKINREGVEKADAEAKRIIDEAKAKADAIVKEAKAEAEKAKAEAERASADYASRAAETIRQGARDVVLGIRESITAVLERLLVRSVDRALQDEATVVGLVSEAIKGISGTGEIVCGEKLARALASALAAAGGFAVVTDSTAGTGFSVKVDGGRVEHAFTTGVIAGELAKRLRPDLAKLLSEETA